MRMRSHDPEFSKPLLPSEYLDIKNIKLFVYVHENYLFGSIIKKIKLNNSTNQCFHLLCLVLA